MKAPCHECTERSATCHAKCKQYALYAKYRQLIRDKRQQEQKITSMLVDGARKIKNQEYRRKK